MPVSTARIRISSLAGVALGAAALCLAACSGRHHAPGAPGPTDPVGTFGGWSGCTCFMAEGFDTLVPPNLDCVEYAYTGDATLLLRHRNAGFNCCPGELAATISTEDTLIIIVERERESLCDCQCLYDLHYTIEHLRPRPYRLRIVEPYLHPDETPLDFRLDLSGPISGRHCEARNQYPWNFGVASPSGWLVGYSGCKLWHEGELDSVTATQDCIAFTYGSDEVLALRHIKAGFNCCPGEITAAIEVTGNLISIEEREAEQGCRCECLFDLTYRIQGLAPGVYRVQVAEPYARPEWGDLRLDFIVDLTVPASDTLCVARTHHPWGFW